MSRRHQWTGFAMMAVCILFVTGVALAAIALPDKLKDIPLYSGATIKQAMDMDKSTMALMEIPAKADDVFEFYKKQLPGKGWKVFSQMQQDTDSLLQCQKGNALLQVAVHSEEDGKVSCTLVLTEQ